LRYFEILLGGCMKKSVIMLVLCGILVFLAACSGKKAAAGGSAAAFNETGFPIVNEAMTLRVIASKHTSTKDYPELPVFQEIEKKTGIAINWEYTGPDWSTNKPLVLASGDLPDLFLGRSALGEGDITGNPGMFMDLEPLIEKYGDNIKAMFREEPAMEQFARAYDGKIYGLPQKMPRRPETYTVMGINQDWLDKLNLKMPTTTEEFYTVLKAFKERDPNGNGIADEVPFSSGGFEDNGGVMPIISSFGVVDSMMDLWLSVTGGKVQYIAAQDGFREAVSYLRRLYAEGLLDQDFGALDWGMWLAKTNPPVGSPDIVGVAGFWGRDIIFGERADHYSVLPPLKGPTGFQAWPRNTEFVQGSKYVAEIPSSSKNSEIIMRWLDVLYDPDTSLRLYYGTPAVQGNGDGTYDIILPPAGSGIDNDTWIWGNSWGDMFPGYGGPSLTQKIRNDFIFGTQYNDKLVYAPYYKEFFPMAAQTPEETDDLSILRADIHGFAKEQTATWIVNGGVEREYDAFIQQLNNMGLSRMVEIYQSIYDRYTGK
jgi:putative aldouronate transport system substrate-binding protein